MFSQIHPYCDQHALFQNIASSPVPVSEWNNTMGSCIYVAMPQKTLVQMSTKMRMIRASPYADIGTGIPELSGEQIPRAQPKSKAQPSVIPIKQCFREIITGKLEVRQ